MGKFLLVSAMFIKSIFYLFQPTIEDEVREGFGDYIISTDEIYKLSNNIKDYAELTDLDPEYIIYQVVDLLDVMVDLQPCFIDGCEGGLDRAADIAWLLYKESKNNNVNQYIATIIAYRESSFLLKTERGYEITRFGYKNYDCIGCHGSLGERGLFQIIPRGAAHKINNCNLYDRECNIKTGIQWLARCRDATRRKFGKRFTIDTWVAAYGRRKMLQPLYAARAPEVKQAKNMLCSVYPQCESIWP